MEVTQITQIRRKVLTMLSKMAYDGNLPDHVYDILQIVQEDSPRLRCCVHKERAVLKERINVALGLDTDLNIIEAAKKAVSEPVDPYQKARRGEIKQFSGIDSPYEPPTAPEIHLDGSLAINELTQQILAYLQQQQIYR